MRTKRLQEILEAHYYRFLKRVSIFASFIMFIATFSLFKSYRLSQSASQLHFDAIKVKEGEK